MDNSCTEECPVDCIYEGERMRYVHPGECIDCGACEAVCPVEAIRPGQRLDPDWVPFRDAAKDLFAVVGSPGGSARSPRPLQDSDFVKAYEKSD